MKTIQAIEYSPRIVAYLDILGFRSLVLSGVNDAKVTIAKLDASLDHTLQVITGETEERDASWCSVKLFSDCICLSCEDTTENLRLMLSEISFLQLYLGGEAIFVSGGLSIGHHYENPRIIFSEGLVRAYDLQARDPFPRVLVDTAVLEKIRREPVGLGRRELLSYIIRGQDGFFFLDYLQYAADVAGYTGTLDEFFVEHKGGIMRQVKANFSSPSIVEKYRWLSEYHNFKFSELFKEEDWVDGYFEQLRERLTIAANVFPSFERTDTEEEG